MALIDKEEHVFSIQKCKMYLKIETKTRVVTGVYYLQRPLLQNFIWK